MKILALLTITSKVWADRPSLPILKHKNSAIVKEYLKHHQKFSKEICPAETEKKFDDLYKAFKGDGRFIPFLPGGELDTDAIGSQIPHLKRKVKWVASIKNKFDKGIELQALFKKMEDLQKSIDNLLELKKKSTFTNSKAIQRQTRIQSKVQYGAFREKFQRFLKDDLFWIQSFDFPIDHSNLRRQYDIFKNNETRIGKQKANTIYFYRKIVEDGAQKFDHTQNDLYLRSLVDSLYIRLRTNKGFIEEDIRYDSEDLFRILKRTLLEGIHLQTERLSEWQERTKSDLDFYLKILALARGKGIDKEKIHQMFTEKERARYVLRKFVIEKEAETYHFWRKLGELHQALFSLETILMNEVGPVEGKETIERKSVSEVVINRFFEEKYAYFLPGDPLLLELATSGLKETGSNPWLNVLFKEGEFSFTYFFISASEKIFCPDLSRRAKRMRVSNLNIALNSLRSYDGPTGVLRYFSRASMLGRFDMAPLWPDYEQVPQSPGRIYSNASKLIKSYKSGKYRYFYSYNDPKGVQYHVFEINDAVVNLGPTGQWYRHRNPQYFRYFRRSKANPSL